MPEATTAPAADTTAATTETAATTKTTTAAPEKSGIDKMMTEFSEVTTPKAAVAKADTKTIPDTKPAEKAEPKPDANTGKAAEPDLWQKAPPKLKNAYFQLRRESDEKIKSFENRIKEIESKAGKETPADTKLVEQYQGQIKALNDRLAAADFRQSESYQKEYVGRWKAEYTQAVNEIKSLKVVTGKDDANNPVARPATEADFQKILSLPAGEQDEVITAAFGPYAPRVFARLLELKRIESRADAAVADHVANAEVQAKESKIKSEREQAAYDALVEAAKTEIQQKAAKYFGDDGKDKEVSDVIKYGMDYVQHVKQNVASMTPDERAAHNTILEMRAAYMPRVVLDLQRAEAKIESLQSELKKFRKSDPGSGEETATTETTTTPEPTGIAAMAAAFKPAQR